MIKSIKCCRAFVREKKVANEAMMRAIPSSQSVVRLAVGLLLGAIFGALFGAVSVYVGLRAGLTVSASSATVTE